MGSKLGSLRVAAKKIGITIDEYLEQEKEGKRWCSIHKRWELKQLFNKEKGRRNGIAPCCKTGKAIRNRISRLKHRYGMTEMDERLLLEHQEYRCAICKKKISKRFHIDHNHITNRVRGILCFSCNTIIGLAKENASILKHAIQYLEIHNGKYKNRVV